MADSDILQQLLDNQTTQEELFRQLNSSLRTISENLPSLAEYENQRYNRRDEDSRRTSREPDEDRWKVDRDSRSSKRQKGFEEQMNDLTDNMFKQFSKQVFGDSIGDMVKGSLADFANSLGVDLGNNLGETMGNLLGNSMANWFKGTDLGGALSEQVQSFKGDIAGSINNLLNSATSRINPEAATQAADVVSEAAGAMSDAVNPIVDVGSAAADAGGALMNVSTEAGAAVGELGSLAAITPGVGLAIVALLVVFDAWTEAIQESWEEVKKAATEFSESIEAASNRVNNMMKFKLEEKMKRLTADFESMITASYDVMKEASQQMLQAWDESLRTITATQGYDKAGMQDLLSNYAQRLRDEGLSSVVSTADLTKNLSSVLESGLSGQVAEEFAYLATILNAAIPTEDFFSYAETYASVAANAIAAGKSQQEAIEYANAELEQFASNLLYSSRELAGGFSTGLKNASNLFKSATEIAVASRTGQASEISGVLTAVSAAVGAVAPDLASSLVDNVVQAALGGNSNSALPALRSLAGVGASNTAFLQALADDAQGVFQTLFANLANLQNMSADNYMEVAEGLSEIFGVSKEAFARVDFSYLADVIGAMSIDGDSLGQNLSMLVSGQTTYTAEQARIAEVNKVMIEEGLAYVLDNEVARALQQHMWDEQLAQEIEETTFGVDLQGKASKLLQTIADLVESILDFLNPMSWMKDGVELLQTVADTAYHQQEIEQLLKATVVGAGNEQSYYNLTHRGTDLNLTQSYLERLGVAAPISLASLTRDATSAALNVFSAVDLLSGRSYTSEARNLLGQIGTSLGQEHSAFSNILHGAAFGLAGTSWNNPTSSSIGSSAYNWSMVGKSSLLAPSLTQSTRTGPYTALSVSTAQEAMTTTSQRNMQDLLDTMQSFVDDQRSFSEWTESATKFGIMDLDQALADFGWTMEDVKGQFIDLETQAGLKMQHEMQEREQEFYEASVTWFTDTYPSDFDNMQDLLLDMHEELMDQLLKSHRQLQDFYDQWVDYYVNHTAYSQETLDAYNVAAIRTAERQEVGDSVLALAEALTSTSIDLKDPAVQTNVLLAKILIITEAIMQQTNDTTTVSLPTALSALSLGVTTEGPVV